MLEHSDQLKTFNEALLLKIAQLKSEAMRNNPVRSCKRFYRLLNDLLPALSIATLLDKIDAGNPRKMIQEDGLNTNLFLNDWHYC